MEILQQFRELTLTLRAYQTDNKEIHLIRFDKAHLLLIIKIRVLSNHKGQT